MKLIPHGVTRSLAHQVLVAKKNSPHIFFAGGVVGVVGAAVLACKATLKLEATIDEVKQDLVEVKEKHDDPNASYPEKQYTKDLGRAYGVSVYKFGRLYGPSVAVGVVSIAALTGSHIQMTKRNTALTATVAAISKAYEEYRVRVREELGEERELELYRNVREDADPVTGELVQTVNPSKYSPYARCFDEANPNWENSAELNYIFIKCQQEYANHRLHTRGYVLLNEVYASLGFEYTSPGAVVGWVYDPYAEGDGDNYIDFGLFEAHSERFRHGDEKNVWLDFNVDGVMYTLIDQVNIHKGV